LLWGQGRESFEANKLSIWLEIYQHTSGAVVSRRLLPAFSALPCCPER
jgi:hypothetical protein